MGFKGKFLQKYTLFALYPTRQIIDKIDIEKRRLVFAGIFAVLIILVLGNLLARSFIFPLREITGGAEAIKNKNFDLRLPALGNDEFGDIAQMFNETMVDFGELKVAGVIQEQLLPQTLPESGKFKLFGRTVSPGDVGGNYYDYFNCGENRFSVLLGKVSGKGVSAALIMAMAKAAVLSSDDQLAESKLMVQKVNLLLCSTQNAWQEHFMSLQYITFDSLGGQASLVNAGGPSPLIVDSRKQTVKEIKLSGPLLGKSANSDFAAIEFRLKEGQALILYTEEVFRANNLAGQEFGYENFIKLVLESFAAEPCEYYNNIHRAYDSHIGGVSELSGDMTMIILTFN
jgi:sigma-B regulation protein RsbU (phosphoserine phosphatase)